ncbi:TetR/AcrR family transcriptional regulator [Nocardia yamanashiensis]|uniref:TetR/AcrR family transcriptional regulator n=1 Tax=Nocardia yamanashiensis TaxID=209247 RepID=UPI00082AE72C|nr:TetR/AcrR family transcriptional regulator [Nocardia yamanashiensis]
MSSGSRPPARRGNPALRTELVEAAIQLLETDGAEALQTRRVAAAAGVSTMAVYTHFGSMTDLLVAVITEAFSRFGATLAAVPATDDPIADFFALGAAYRAYALANPQRYRLMFGLTGPSVGGSQYVCDFTESAPPDAIGAETFEHAVTAAERMIATGHLRPDPPRRVAARLWALLHGTVLLEIAGNLGVEGRSVATVLGPATVDILVGMGANREQAERSARLSRQSV